jgi:hypothetical protein
MKNYLSIDSDTFSSQILLWLTLFVLTFPTCFQLASRHIPFLDQILNDIQPLLFSPLDYVSPFSK